MTVDEVPSHKHLFLWSGSHTHNRYKNTNTNGWWYDIGGTLSPTTYYTSIQVDSTDPYNNAPKIADTTINISKDTEATGSGNAHNNMPPYITKYCWERTA